MFLSGLHLDLVLQPKKRYGIGAWNTRVLETRQDFSGFSGVIFPLTLDHLIEFNMGQILRGKKTRRVKKKFILLFEPLLFDELVRYMELKKTKISIKRPKCEMMHDVEERFPGTKYSIYKAFLNMH